MHHLQAPLVAQRMQQLQQDLAETSAVARTLQAERLQVHSEYQRLCMEAAANDHHAIMLSGLVDEGCLELATCQHQLQQAKCGSSASSICAVDTAEQETQTLARLQRTYDHIAGHLQVRCSH
jgi:hypothetical protein